MFKLEALRRYGNTLPVAIINVGGNASVYDVDGVRDLMRVYRDSEAYPVLVDIERQMLMPGEYKDIQDEDFSGQKTFFESD